MVPPGFAGIRANAAWPGGAQRRAQHVAADNEVLVGVQGLAGANQIGPGSFSGVMRGREH